MLAIIEKGKNGYSAEYRRHISHNVDEVWAWLTVNEKLEKWFPELRIDELRIGGIIKFDFGDGTTEKMEILDLVEKSVFEYTWGDDYVRFELHPKSDGCQLILIEKIKKISDHTPKDLAGWHVCLDVIKQLMDGKTVDSQTKDWEKWYKKYVDLVEKLAKKL